MVLLWESLFEPQCRYSNSSPFSSISFSSVQQYTELRFVWRVEVSSAVCICLPILVSSAKLQRNEDATFWPMLLIMIRNSKGPRTDPWGTPDLTFTFFDCALLTNTVWYRLIRKLWIQFPIFPVNPSSLIFLRVKSKFTLSNALAVNVYINIMPIC